MVILQRLQPYIRTWWLILSFKSMLHVHLHVKRTASDSYRILTIYTENLKIYSGQLELSIL